MISIFTACFTALFLLLAVSTNNNGCLGFSLTMSTSSINKGSAAKPFEKKKIAVFGAGGYMGACVFGFLQRAGSLYGTGIAGIGAPRAIVATASGSAGLNGVLSGNFVLAQAGETFIRPTDMMSAESIGSKIGGFDAAIVATRYCFKTVSVTSGTYGKGPNDKTKEFYMDQPRSATSALMDDPEYSANVFNNTLAACKNSNKLRHLVVIETDAEFDNGFVGDKYLQLLEESEVPYTYIRPVGRLENIKSFTFKKGIQSDLKISRANSVEELLPVEENKIVYREHIAAVCVQALMTLGWEDNRVIQVDQSPGELDFDPRKVTPSKEWCVNSVIIMNALAGIP
jgi:hypothetical protein